MLATKFHTRRQIRNFGEIKKIILLYRTAMTCEIVSMAVWHSTESAIPWCFTLSLCVNPSNNSIYNRCLLALIHVEQGQVTESYFCHVCGCALCQYIKYLSLNVCPYLKMATEHFTDSFSFLHKNKIANLGTGWSKCLCAPDDYNPHAIDDLKMVITEYIRNVDRAIPNTVF